MSDRSTRVAPELYDALEDLVSRIRREMDADEQGWVSRRPGRYLRDSLEQAAALLASIRRVDLD